MERAPEGLAADGGRTVSAAAGPLSGCAPPWGRQDGPSPGPDSWTNRRGGGPCSGIDGALAAPQQAQGPFMELPEFRFIIH